MAQAQSLFRQEAILHRRQRQWGETLLLQPLSAKVLFVALLLAVAAGSTFLTTAQYARKETVVGYVAPAAGVVRVHVPRAGTVRSVAVREGDTVVAGQPLLTVGVEQTAADGSDVDDTLLASLAAQKELLSQRIANQESHAALERQRLEAQIGGLAQEIEQLAQQVAMQEERAKLAGKRAKAVATLSKQGIVPVLEHERRREVHLELRQSLAALREQLAARENQLTTSRLALEQLPGTTADKLQVLQKELLEADQRIAEIEGRRAFVVRAPAAGRISALQASVGRAADPRQPQLSILPKDGRLEARLFVPTRAVGFVRTGQEVRILYDAFPFQRFGAHAGRVTRVTRSVLTPTDLVAPIVPQEAVYEVTVKLAHQDVQADGVTVPLRADMLLKADIILERRSLLRWLLDPLLQARMH